MPFGKYKGQLVDDLPVDYLVWLQRNLELKPSLAWAVEEAIERKRRSYYYTPPPPPADHSVEIKLIFRSLAKKYHPDLGGNVVAMQALNEFYERLNELSKW